MSRDVITLETKDTHFENVLASYLNEREIKLSPLEEEMKQRWETAFSLLLNTKGREESVRILKGKFNISLATAYRDINRALSLFGDITKSRKEGWRYVIFEYNQKLLQMAEKAQDLHSMGKCLDRMIKLAELDKEESNFNPEKLQAQIYEIGISKVIEDAFMKKINTGTLDLNGVVLDVPHKEILDEKK